MKLHCFAITKNTTIRQIIMNLDMKGIWDLTIFEHPSHLFSASPESMDFLIIDEASDAANYMQITKKARKLHPLLDVMVIGGPKSKDVLLREEREAVDVYYSQPLDNANLTSTIQHAISVAALKSTAGLVGRSHLIKDIIESVLLVGPTEVPILIQGESGTGKDVLAKAIHAVSKRSDAPFDAINCASLAEGVLESELFGHEKGSFTGAVGKRMGIFERAHGGTIFLDEIGEMSPNMQVRLLRVLESGEVLRVGGIKNFQVNVRLISATNRNLSESVTDGSFRQDLYYRLKGVNFKLPALRERPEDIPHLVDYFISAANKKHGKRVKGIRSDALRKMASYSWPGNVRELKNMIDTLVVLTGEDRINAESVDVQLSDDKPEIRPMLPVAAGKTQAEAEREMIYASILSLHRDVKEVLQLIKGRASSGPWDNMAEVLTQNGAENRRVETLSQIERAAIREALRSSGGNRRKAAAMLGISERTLYRKINEYGLI